MQKTPSRPESSTKPQILLWERAARTGHFSHIQSCTRQLQGTFLNTTPATRATKSTRHTFPPISILGAPELESRDMPQNSPLRSKKQSRCTLNTPSTMSLRRDWKNPLCFMFRLRTGHH